MPGDHDVPLKVSHRELGEGIVLSSATEEWLVRFDDGDYVLARSQFALVLDPMVEFRSPLDLGPYHPYWGGSNRAFGAEDQRILDLKNGMPEAVAYWTPRLLAELGPLAEHLMHLDVAVCAVPSHNPTRLVTGIRRVAQQCAEHFRWIDATRCLIRTLCLPPQHGGERQPIHTLAASMRVDDPGTIAGTCVILMDDIRTSGASLTAGTALLEAAGATSVKPVALGRTVAV